MNRLRILIAERDYAIRKELVRTASAAGYQVKTASSVAPLLDNLLRKRFPVVLLGDNFEKNIQVADLLRLMKASNPHAAIILISDDISLLQVRKARELGIFYHALQPVNAEDWQELTQVMECAFKSSLHAAHPLRKPHFAGAAHSLEKEITHEIHDSPSANGGGTARIDASGARRSKGP